MKVILVTFATEGHPHDNGLPIAQHCLEPFVKAVLNSGIDEVIALTPRLMIPILGEELTRRCTRQLPPPVKIRMQGYHDVGMGDWRSKLLKYVVDTHNDGDIVIFHDPNWKRYPGILSGFAPRARDYATAAITVANRSEIFSPPHLTLIHTVTRSVFERLRDPEKTGRRHSSLIYQPAGRARCIVLRISPQTRLFVKKFSEACDINDNLLGGIEAILPNGGWSKPGFIHNAGEQAVFNALLYGCGLWDSAQDDWLLPLKDIGLHDRDTGAEALINWATVHRGWKPR